MTSLGPPRRGQASEGVEADLTRKLVTKQMSEMLTAIEDNP